MKPNLPALLPYLVIASALLSSAHAASYSKSKEIPIGGEGGWDYFSVEESAHRLYVSHATKVVVIDTTTDAVVGEIDDTPGVHGIAFAPKLGLGFVSNGRENKVSIFDLKTLKTKSKVETGANPDAILFEPEHSEVYAFNGRGQSVTIFAAETGQVVATLPVGGKPEFAQADPEAHRVFFNLEDKNEVAVIDTKTHTITQHWPIAPGEEPTGMGIDLEHHRLFLGCGNSRLIVLDSQDGHVVNAIAAGQGIDAAGFDPSTQLVFTPNGRDGTLTIVHQDSPDHYSVVQTLPTEVSARTMTVDLASHKLYLGSGKFEPATGGGRPKMTAGSFKILVCELKEK